MTASQNNLGSHYPAVDLSDPVVLEAQINNLVSFRAKWVSLIVTIALMFGVLFVIKSLPTEWRETSYSGNAILIMACYFMYRMFRYNCPHCGECPMSVSISGDGSSFNYNKGVALFPKRCTKCGYYLSKRALEADLEKLASKQSE